MSVGYTKDFEPANRVAQALVKAAPERMLWGSDWPHPVWALRRSPTMRRVAKHG